MPNWSVPWGYRLVHQERTTTTRRDTTSSKEWTNAWSPEKVKIMQNKLLKLLLKWDRQTPTDLVHYHLSILKINDMHTAKILSFVNECRSGRVPDIFVNYYKIRETGLNLRDRSSLDIPWARTDMGLSRCDVKGARLWNNNLQAANPLLHKKSFHKQLSKFLVSRYI